MLRAAINQVREARSFVIDAFVLLLGVMVRLLFSNAPYKIGDRTNVTGNAVLDGDRLRFSNSGLSGQTFILENTIYNLSLLGFSSDGGNTLISEFNSPEGTTAYASLYGKIQAIGSIAPSPAPSPSPITPSPEPIVSLPIEVPPVEAPWETPPAVPEPQTMLGMILGLGFLVRTRLKQKSRGQ